MNDISAKLAQATVLLNRQYLLLDHLIQNSNHVLQDLETAIINKQQSLSHVLDVYCYIFGLIDHLVRYQKIAHVLPQLNQKNAEYRAFNSAMGELKDIRNQLQHINNDIENDYSGPLLGAVCWVSGQRHFFISFNDVGRSRSSPGIVLDTQTGNYTKDFCFVYNDVYHDLGKAINGSRVFNEYISSRVHVEVDGKPYNVKEHFIALCMQLTLPEKKI